MTMSYIDSFVSHGCAGNCKQIGGSTHASERTTGELRRTRRTSNNSEQKCSSHKHMQQYGNTMQAVPPACSLWFANDLQQLISILWPPVLLFSSSVEPVTTALLLSTRHGVITVVTFSVLRSFCPSTMMQQPTVHLPSFPSIWPITSKTITQWHPIHPLTLVLIPSLKRMILTQTWLRDRIS